MRIMRASSACSIRRRSARGVHPSAVVHSAVPIPPSASVGEMVVIGRDVKLGENVTIYPGA